MRKQNLLFLTCAAALGFGLFQMKNSVKGLEKKLSHVERDVLKEEESIHVLKAELSYLLNPARLKKLGQELTQLTPTPITSIVSFKNLHNLPVVEATQ